MRGNIALSSDGHRRVVSGSGVRSAVKRLNRGTVLPESQADLFPEDLPDPGKVPDLRGSGFSHRSCAAVREYDLFSAARFLHVPVEFLDYKLRFLSCRGIFPGYRDLLSVKSDCMRNMKLADGSYDQGH